MSDSSRHNLSYIVESVFGTTPTNPLMKRLRHVACSLGLSKTTLISEELRSDRQITDYNHGMKQTGGDITAELTYATLDDLLEATLCGTWTVKAPPMTADTISAAAADNSINDSGNGFVTAFPGLEVGDRLSIAGFTGTAGNNQTATVVSIAAGKIVLTTGTPLVNDAAGESVTITPLSYRLKAGTTRRSFSFMREFADQGSNQFHVFSGSELSKFTTTIGVDQIIRFVFSILGKQDAAPGSEPASTTYTAANTNPTMNSLSGTLKEGGSTSAIVTELQLTLENGLEPKPNIGNDTVQTKASIGRSNLSGQLTGYFEDATLLNKFRNGTESSLNLTIADSATPLARQYVVGLPRVKYNGGQPDTAGQGAITLACPFQALLDATTGTQIWIDRHPIS